MVVEPVQMKPYVCETIPTVLLLVAMNIIYWNSFVFGCRYVFGELFDVISVICAKC